MTTQKQKTATRKMTPIILIMLIISIFEISLNVNYVNAQGITTAEKVGVLDSTICCEKTKSGLYCQNVPENECAPNSKMPKTSCESTSFCNPGFCYDSKEGTCLDNVPQEVCNVNKGTWSAEKPTQCNLGCCSLNDQASFVTLVRCKRLSSFYGLSTNWNPEVTDETQCILSAGLKQKGACVYIKDFEKTCKMTTKEQCTSDIIDNTNTVASSGSSANANRNLEGLTSSGGTASGTNAGSTTTSGASASGTSTTGTAAGTTAIENSNLPNGSVSTSPPGGNITGGGVAFYPGKLCTSEELGTNCGPTKQTTCVPGKEEVYFVDTCGNAANIYDSTKANNINYWSDLKDKSEVCNPNNANENNPNCGNCNYILGSYCREANSETAKPKLGTNICQSLNCVDENGEKKLHGESWCVYDVNGYNFKPVDYPGALGNAIGNNAANKIGAELAALVDSSVSSIKGGKGFGAQLLTSSAGPVGSRFFRQICINGEIKTEPCADFRQEECLQNIIDTSQGKFTEAACRVNRWQDCTAQINSKECLNIDRRDCTWMMGIQYMLMGAVLNGTSMSDSNLATVKDNFKAKADAAGGLENLEKGACVPKNPPGLKFWQGDEAKTVCAQANALCPVTYEKGIGGEWECSKNCECDPDENPQILAQRAQVCMALGDCGPKVNYIGEKGYTKGYEVIKKKLKKE